MSRPLDRVPPAMPAAPAVGEEQRRWERETRAPFVKAHPERREPFVTQALKWPIKPLYTPADLDASGFDYLRDLGFPGEYPFTRATQPNDAPRACDPRGNSFGPRATPRRSLQVQSGRSAFRPAGRHR
jgi:hypothetical protein